MYITYNIYLCKHTSIMYISIYIYINAYIDINHICMYIVYNTYLCIYTSTPDKVTKNPRLIFLPPRLLG